MRKVIQLETFIGKEIENLFALCDDGTIFAYSNEGEWWKLPAIPQEKSQSEPEKLLKSKFTFPPGDKNTLYETGKRE